MGCGHSGAAAGARSEPPWPPANPWAGRVERRLRGRLDRDRPRSNRLSVFRPACAIIVTLTRRGHAPATAQPVLSGHQDGLGSARRAGRRQKRGRQGHVGQWQGVPTRTSTHSRLNVVRGDGDQMEPERLHLERGSQVIGHLGTPSLPLHLGRIGLFTQQGDTIATSALHPFVDRGQHPPVSRRPRPRADYADGPRSDGPSRRLTVAPPQSSWWAPAAASLSEQRCGRPSPGSRTMACSRLMSSGGTTRPQSASTQASSKFLDPFVDGNAVRQERPPAAP